MKRSRQNRLARSGQTLLELVGATTLLALAIIPALRLMRDSLRIGRETETTQLLATLACSRLEQYLLQSAGGWRHIPAGNSWGTTTHTGNHADEGLSSICFQVTQTDQAPNGIPGSLLSITALVWSDANGNGTWDTGELRTVAATKLARNAAYSNEAAGT